MTDKITDPHVERRMRRFLQPDGRCYYCERPADHLHPVGPLVVTVKEPNDEELHHEFCCWECLGHWAAVQAGWDNYPLPLDT